METEGEEQDTHRSVLLIGSDGSVARCDHLLGQSIFLKHAAADAHHVPGTELCIGSLPFDGVTLSNLCQLSQRVAQCEALTFDADRPALISLLRATIFFQADSLESAAGEALAASLSEVAGIDALATALGAPHLSLESVAHEHVFTPPSGDDAMATWDAQCLDEDTLGELLQHLRGHTLVLFKGLSASACGMARAVLCKPSWRARQLELSLDWALLPGEERWGECAALANALEQLDRVRVGGHVYRLRELAHKEGLLLRFHARGSAIGCSVGWAAHSSRREPSQPSAPSLRRDGVGQTSWEQCTEELSPPALLGLLLFVVARAPNPIHHLDLSALLSTLTPPARLAYADGLGAVVCSAPHERAVQVVEGAVSCRLVLSCRLITANVQIQTLLNSEDESVNLASRRLSPEDMSVVVAALSGREPRSLTHLRLDSNALDAHGMRRLGRLLERSTLVGALSRLDLSANGFGDDGLLELAAALCAEPLGRLRILGLGSNQIGTRGLQGLVVRLQEGALPGLELLALQDNAIRDEGLAALARAIGAGALPQLQWLNVERNGIGLAGFEALCSVSAMMNNLRTLNVGSNDDTARDLLWDTFFSRGVSIFWM